ncbi:MAG TPA: hypothetical protein VJP80_00555 [Candidatus Saccharimonadales bacterium]|nr:hypothetical protein [Candidatus Saccharimonadales bacterium]
MKKNDQYFRKKLFIVIGLTLCVMYVALALTPSSYAIGLQMLGQPVAGLFAGTPKAIRSDEWMVFTPYVQIAVKSAYASHDMISPYHESLRAFFALPSRDWALAFKPYFFAFGLLPPANAFSFFYLFNMLAFLLGWAIFLRQMGLNNTLALTGSLVLFFSQFVQVWWTSNSGVFALAPWPAIAWIAIRNRPLRVVATAYSLTVWLLADAYPPFLYAYGFVLAISIVAMRRDLITKERVIDVAVAGAFAGVIFLSYFGDLIRLMQNTAYPGRRMSGGGGVELAKLIAHLFPFSLTHQYEPLKTFTNTNTCEIAVVGSLLPITCAVFLDYNNIAKLTENWRTLAIIMVGIIVSGVWIFLPIPAEIGRFAGLTFVPGNRLLPALGWLLIILSLYIANTCGCRYSMVRVSCFFGLAVAGALIKCWINGSIRKGAFGYFDALPFSAVLVLAIATYFGARGWGISLGLAAIVSAVSYGSFNPIQSAYPIFSLDTTAVMSHLKLAGARSKDGYIAVPGEYGALINGAGIPAINHVLLSPQLEFFKARFGDLPNEKFNELFNRYEHISLSLGEEPKLVQPDLVSLPMSRFVGPNLSPAGAGKIVRFAWTRDSSDGHATLEGCVSNVRDGLVLHDRDVPGGATPLSLMGKGESAGCFTGRFNYRSLNTAMVLRDEATKSAAATALIFAQLASEDSVRQRLSTAKRSGVVDELQVSDDGRRVRLQGWAAADGAHQMLYNIYSEAELSGLDVSRVERPDVAERVDPSYKGAGFNIELSSNYSLVGKRICVEVEDSVGTASELTFPGGKSGCIEVTR